VVVVTAVDLDPRRKVVETPLWYPEWDGMSASGRVEDFMGRLTVPQGRGAGDRFRLREWQRTVQR
jgi:hypothetical protein